MVAHPRFAVVGSLLFAGSALLFGCTDVPSDAASNAGSGAVAAPETIERTLTLAGSSTIQPIMESAAAAWEKSHPGDTVQVQGGGSGVGVSAAQSGLADIGMVSRSLKPEESALTATAFARDGIAIIVHATHPLSAISHAQVVGIYDGTTTAWDALGAQGAPITLISKEAGRSTLELFEHHFDLKGKIAPSAVIIGPNGQAITTTAGDPNAISYVSIGSAAVAESQGTPIKRLTLDGVAASVENVGNGTYPLCRPLNLVTKGQPTGLAAEFIGFVLSPEGQAIVAKEDFIPLSVTPPVASGN